MRRYQTTLALGITKSSTPIVLSTMNRSLYNNNEKCIYQCHPNIMKWWAIEIYFQFHSNKCSAEMRDKFLSNWKSLNMNLAASILHEILRQDVRPLSEWRPWIFSTPSIEHMARTFLCFLWFGTYCIPYPSGLFLSYWTILQLPQYKWSNPEEYGYLYQMNPQYLIT